MTLSEKIVAVSLAALAGIASLFAAGICVIYVFSKIVWHFSVSTNTQPQTLKRVKIAIFDTIAKESEIALGKEILNEDNIQKPPLTLSEAKELPLQEVFTRYSPPKYATEALGVTDTESNTFTASLTKEEKSIQSILHGKLNIFFASLATLKDVELPERYLVNLCKILQGFLDNYCDSPFKFLHVINTAATAFTDLNRFPLYAWEVLGMLKWPSDALKYEQLSEILEPIFDCQYPFSNCAEWKTFLDKDGNYQQPFPLNLWPRQISLSKAILNEVFCKM